MTRRRVKTQNSGRIGFGERPSLKFHPAYRNFQCWLPFNEGNDKCAYLRYGAHADQHLVVVGFLLRS